MVFNSCEKWEPEGALSLSFSRRIHWSTQHSLANPALPEVWCTVKAVTKREVNHHRKPENCKLNLKFPHWPQILLCSTGLVQIRKCFCVTCELSNHLFVPLSQGKKNICFSVLWFISVHFYAGQFEHVWFVLSCVLIKAAFGLWSFKTQSKCTEKQYAAAKEAIRDLEVNNGATQPCGLCINSTLTINLFDALLCLLTICCEKSGGQTFVVSKQLCKYTDLDHVSDLKNYP